MHCIGNLLVRFELWPNFAPCV